MTLKSLSRLISLYVIIIVLFWNNLCDKCLLVVNLSNCTLFQAQARILPRTCDFTSSYLLLRFFFHSLIFVVSRHFTPLFEYSNIGFTPDKIEKIPTDPFLNGVYYAVSYWTEKGGIPYQEDRFNAIKGTGSEDSSLYAVFDGEFQF